MRKVHFQLLEINLISAQDLSPATKKLHTYATIYINTERKLRTRIDQIGRNNPTWNEKFVFKVDNEFLDSKESMVVIEIHATGWLKDTPVGFVQVSINDLIPHFARTPGGSSSRRIVALQIRRHSGRPQGILNVGVTLLDNTMRSMPSCTEPSQENDSKADKNGKQPKLGQENEAKIVQLKRSKSDLTNWATENASSRCNDPPTLPNNVPYGSSMIGSVMGGETKGQGVNGSVCCSDIGPSPSIVALAVARGLILTPVGVSQNSGGSILADWKAEESTIEGLQSKIGRWRTEHEPLVAAPNTNYPRSHISSAKTSNVRKLRRSKTDSGGLFTCFGNACGCEIKIVCGQNNNRKYRNRIAHQSWDNESSIITTTW